MAGANGVWLVAAVGMVVALMVPGGAEAVLLEVDGPLSVALQVPAAAVIVAFASCKAADV